jgi:quercetin dioxygenase-like cupin family protein
MRPRSAVISAVALLGLAAVVPTADAKSVSPAPPEAVFMNASELKWGEPPPELPKGAQLAVLFGDPTKKGTFTMRLKMPDGYKIPPHWHTLDENLTILSGTFLLHMGDKMDSPAHELKVGAYHFLPGKAHHAAEAKGETVVQIHGMGPFDIHYLNPADNPNKHAAATK